ncbi:hypothetical protein [Marivirga sp.]|uniref:hypothetical protein n=1 Tax=Marivirga sp. TaxID=2018662 RepID=UPI003DA6E085
MKNLFLISMIVIIFTMSSCWERGASEPAPEGIIAVLYGNENQLWTGEDLDVWYFDQDGDSLRFSNQKAVGRFEEEDTCKPYYWAISFPAIAFHQKVSEFYLIYGEDEQFQDTVNVDMNNMSIKELYFNGDLIDRVEPDNNCDGASFYEFYLKTDK